MATIAISPNLVVWKRTTSGCTGHTSVVIVELVSGAALDALALIFHIVNFAIGLNADALI